MQDMDISFLSTYRLRTPWLTKMLVLDWEKKLLFRWMVVEISNSKAFGSLQTSWWAHTRANAKIRRSKNKICQIWPRKNGEVREGLDCCTSLQDCWGSHSSLKLQPGCSYTSMYSYSSTQYAARLLIACWCLAERGFGAGVKIWAKKQNASKNKKAVCSLFIQPGWNCVQYQLKCTRSTQFSSWEFFSSDETGTLI
jgi:hypothetical protein